MSVINTTDWDDTLLVKAYESSLKLAQEELARRIARATNGKKVPTKNREDAAPSSVVAEPTACTSNSKQSEEENPSFTLGDYARATYDDGVDYEGKIIALDEEQGTCRIRYIGYENEQEVRICDLVPSWGKKNRRMQFNRAKQELDPNEASTSGCDAKQKIKTQFPTAPNGFPIGAIPPPPPMPPMLGQGQCENSEHLSAMLMSWYMSGYYTGIYQGMQMAKANNTKQKK
ncbi:survival motor neuron protein [Episyrphus balteatus]|uniref:survival motor neuron protein n=1 Tax=Episyrphus balteatus TaxID=286459 RepID=UPI002485EC78|nr:survival motor neuron protein [Episyrphus balteatus]